MIIKRNAFERKACLNQKWRTGATVWRLTTLLLISHVNSHATCPQLSAGGYTVDSTVTDISSCQRRSGYAWSGNCCFACTVSSSSNSNYGSSGTVIAAGETFATIADALASNLTKGASQTLQLLPGTYQGASNCKINIGSDSMKFLGLCGADSTIVNCSSNVWHLNVSAQNFVLEGVTLTNGRNHDDGGCIFIAEPARGITIINSVISNCQTEANGGAIGVIGLDDTTDKNYSIILSGTRILNSYSMQNGGAISISVKTSGTQSQNPAQMCNIDVSLLSGSLLSSNSAENYGGAISLGIASGIFPCVSVTIGNDSSISGNSATLSGGGLAVTSSSGNQIGTVSVSNGQIKNICQTDPSTWSCPAGPSQSLFYDNKASDGGAIYAFGGGKASLRVLLYALQLSNNFASGLGSGLGYGGALDASSVSLIAGCCSLVSNSARLDGGAARMYKASLILFASEMGNNSAGASGGALLLESMLTSVTTQIMQCNLSSNQATSGGALFVRQSSGPLQISSSVLRLNSALQGSGGAVTIMNSAGVVTIQGSELSDNFANLHGGALYVSSKLEAAQNPMFSPSWVKNGYGVQDLADGNVPTHILSATLFRRNAAGTGMGAVAAAGKSRLALSSVTLDSNTARYGGGLACKDTANVSINASTISNNRADYGGGVQLQDSCGLNLVSSLISRNLGSVCGGGFSINSTAPVRLSGSSTLEQNSAASGGAGCIMLVNANSTSECHNLLGVYPLMFELESSSNLYTEGNTADNAGGAFFLSCIMPGNATTAIWFSQNSSFTSEKSSTVRRSLAPHSELKDPANVRMAVGTTRLSNNAGSGCPSGCVAGQYIAADVATCKVCAACKTVCPRGSYLSGTCDGTTRSDLTCIPCTQVRCEMGNYTYGTCDGTGTSDLSCRPCATSCDYGTFMLGTCDGTGTSDIQCVPCKQSCPKGQFMWGICFGTTSHDTVACRPCSTCPSGTIATSICDGTTHCDVVTCGAEGSTTSQTQQTTVIKATTCMDVPQPQTLTSLQGSLIPTFESSYGPKFDCYWFINPSSGSKLQIDFRTFQTEQGPDYVEIFVCEKTTGCMQSANRVLSAGPFSGFTTPATITLSNTQNGVLVRFVSDPSICFAGFTADYCIPGISCISSSTQLITYQVVGKNASMQFLGNTARLYGEFLATAANTFEFVGSENHAYRPGDQVGNSVHISDSFNQTVRFNPADQPFVQVQVYYEYLKAGMVGKQLAAVGASVQYTPLSSGIWNLSQPASGTATMAVQWYFTKSQGFVDYQASEDSTGVQSLGQVAVHTLQSTTGSSIVGGIDCSKGTACRLERKLSRLDCLINQTFALSTSGFTSAWTSAMSGVCSGCIENKYNIKINGITGDDIESCQPCPDGAVCLNANLTWLVDGIQYDIREIQIQNIHPSLANRSELNNRQYQISSCPPGHALINSTTGTSYGIFDHDKQTCQPCQNLEYIVDQRVSCETCPSGASCNGETGVLVPNDGSYWRREGGRMRVWKCDPGYVMVRDDSANGERAIFDSCQQCLPGTYSVTGAQVVNLTECAIQPDSAILFLCPDISWTNVVGFSDVTINGSWVRSPGLAQQQCLTCPGGASCNGGSDVSPLQGFWTINNTADAAVFSRRAGVVNFQDVVTVYRCPAGSCDAGGQCAEGRYGPVCGLCKPGYAMSSGKCDQCTSDLKNSQIAFATGGTLFLIALLYLFSFRPLFQQTEEIDIDQEEYEDCLDTAQEQLEENANGGKKSDDLTDQNNQQAEGNLKSLALKEKVTGMKLGFKGKISGGTIVQRLVQFTAFVESHVNLDVVKLFFLGYAKVLISFYQVLSTFVSNYRVTWPIDLVSLFQYAAVLRFDLISFPGPNCVVAEYSYTQRLLAYTLFPPIILILLCIAPMLSAIYLLILKRSTTDRYEVFKKKHDAVQDQFWYSLLFFLFLVYPTVSVATLRSFNCQYVGSYGALLLADFSEKCPYEYQGDSSSLSFSNVMSTKNFIFSWSFFCAFVYPLGVPTFFLLMLWFYKVPDIAEKKLTAAKIDALVVAYRKKATPIEIELLIRQLRADGLMTENGILDGKINVLFDVLVRQGGDSKYAEQPISNGCAEQDLSVRHFYRFFTQNVDVLGLPNPDISILEEIVKAKDITGDGKIDRQEFIEMMHQMIVIAQLFTGHEELDDMHFEQLSRLYEYHKSGRMYLELKDTPKKKSGVASNDANLESAHSMCADSKGEENSHSEEDKEESFVAKLWKSLIERLMGERIRKNRVHHQQDFSRKIQHSVEACSTKDKLAGEVKDSSDVPDLEFLGTKAMMRLQKSLPRWHFERLKKAVLKDLKIKLIELAKKKALEGSIAIPAVSWQSGVDKHGNTSRNIQPGEEKAVKRIGFLVKNYKVQFWHFELLEMFRKLMMTSVVTFIYTGTPAQIAAAMVVTLLALIYTQRTKPFVDDSIGDMQVFSLMAQCFTLLYGLMLAIHELTAMVGLVESYAQNGVTSGIGGFVVFLNASIVVFPFLKHIGALLNKQLHKFKLPTTKPNPQTEAALALTKRDASKWNTSMVNAVSHTVRTLPAAFQVEHSLQKSQEDNTPTVSYAWKASRTPAQPGRVIMSENDNDAAGVGETFKPRGSGSGVRSAAAISEMEVDECWPLPLPSAVLVSTAVDDGRRPPADMEDAPRERALEHGAASAEEIEAMSSTAITEEMKAMPSTAIAEEMKVMRPAAITEEIKAMPSTVIAEDIQARPSTADLLREGEAELSGLASHRSVEVPPPAAAKLKGTGHEGNGSVGVGQ